MAARKTHSLSYCLLYRLTTAQECMRKLFIHFISILSTTHTAIGHLKSKNIHCAFLKTILVSSTRKKKMLICYHGKLALRHILLPFPCGSVLLLQNLKQRAFTSYSVCLSFLPVRRGATSLKLTDTKCLYNICVN